MVSSGAHTCDRHDQEEGVHARSMLIGSRTQVALSRRSPRSVSFAVVRRVGCFEVLEGGVEGPVTDHRHSLEKKTVSKDKMFYWNHVSILAQNELKQASEFQETV